LLNEDFITSNYTTKFLETYRTDEEQEGVHFDAAAIISALYSKRQKDMRSFSTKNGTRSSTTGTNKWGMAGRSEAIRVRRGW